MLVSVVAAFTTSLPMTSRGPPWTSGTYSGASLLDLVVGPLMVPHQTMVCLRSILSTNKHTHAMLTKISNTTPTLHNRCWEMLSLQASRDWNTCQVAVVFKA